VFTVFIHKLQAKWVLCVSVRVKLSVKFIKGSLTLRSGILTLTAGWIVLFVHLENQNESETVPLKYIFYPNICIKKCLERVPKKKGSLTLRCGILTPYCRMAPFLHSVFPRLSWCTNKHWHTHTNIRGVCECWSGSSGFSGHHSCPAFSFQ